MKPKLVTLLFVVFVAVAHVGAEVTLTDAEGRLRMALQIARERNDRALVTEVEQTGAKLMRELKADSMADVDPKLRVLETKVGIDPGGWSMVGQPLFHPTAEMLARLPQLRTQLVAAMESNDAKRVRSVTSEMLVVLGNQAGVPDGRRAGIKPDARALDEIEATKLFLDALDSEGSRLRPLLVGMPLPDQMLRFYGYLLDATATIRPFAAKHQPARLMEIDRLMDGLVTILTGLQQPAGHFPFPDLRGKNIRFGAMTERQLAAGQVEVRDGWIVSPDPDGGSQFDTGVCGVALLRAAEVRGKTAWKQAGLRAADWALAQKNCANFNYNAFSVSLLAQAWRISREERYLAGALEKFRVGVAPGQAPNGRWIDAHNARTVYHLIILRSLGDLTAALPAGRNAERAELDAVTRPAIKALRDEFDAMGHTVEALPELQTLSRLFPGDTRLQRTTSLMAAGIVGKCTDGRRVRMGAQPNQLAAVAEAAAK